MNVMKAGSAIVVMCALLAGCGGPPAFQDTAPTSPGFGQEPANATVEFLNWRVGESWVHHWYIGANDTDEILVKVVVAEERSDGWLLAVADNATHAAMHGAFVFPTLGLFGATKTAADVGDNHWPWYQFPMQNGTWADTLTSRDDAGASYNYPVQTTVTAKPGTPGAYDLKMRTGEFLVAKYDYLPASHWFGEMRIYDSAKVSAPDDWVIRIVTEQHSYGFQGTFYEDSGELLLAYHNIQTPGATPSPSASFTMTAEQNKLFTIRVTFAAVGAQETALIDPSMDPAAKAVHHQEAYGADGSTVNIDLFDGIPGTWQVVGTGIGVATGSIVFAYGIHERVGTV